MQQKSGQTEAQLHTPSNAEEEQQSKEACLVEDVTMERVDNTPFHLVGTEKQGYFLTMGKHKLIDNRPTKAEALECLETMKWEIVANMVTILHETILMHMFPEGVEKN